MALTGLNIDCSINLTGLNIDCSINLTGLNIDCSINLTGLNIDCRDGQANSRQQYWSDKYRRCMCSFELLMMDGKTVWNT